MSNASLAIYLGESYAEIEIRIGRQSIVHKQFFLPQISLKNIISQCVKTSLPEGCTITQCFLVTKYFDRLKTFRLGGSVIQLLDDKNENNYTFEDSSKLSLAATSLIISLPQNFNFQQHEIFLTEEIQRLKKINAETKKIVISLKSIDPKQLSQIIHFFEGHDFKVFNNPAPHDMNSLRRTLINAGSEGTKDEIISEIKEVFPEAQIKFWVKDEFTDQFENIDLFFSADQFLLHKLNTEKKDIIIHTDIERWIVLKKEKISTWDSPWGKINYDHNITQNIGLHPFAEIIINESGQLSFSSTPAAIEPGPILAGRSVKTLILDAFYSEIANDPSLSQLFPQTLTTQIANKISSQFKVLEKGQVHYDEPLGLPIIQDFIINKLGYDILLHKTKIETIIWTGHLNKLFQKLNNNLIEFSWTNEIFKKV